MRYEFHPEALEEYDEAAPGNQEGEFGSFLRQNCEPTSPVPKRPRQCSCRDECQPDDLRHHSWRPVTKMALYRIAHHLSQFFERVALSDDGVTQGGGDIAAVDVVRLHVEDDFTHIARLSCHRKMARLGLRCE